MFNHSQSKFSITTISDEDFPKLNVLSKNKYIISRISKFSALTNKAFFRQNLEKRFKKWGILDNLEYIHVSDTEMIDDFGRCTYFYVKIGPHTIHILQPGSFTFNSGVESGAQLVCHHDGCQQNGPVMGMGCACFLSKVLSELTKEYQMRCIQNAKNVNKFCPKSFKEAAIRVLRSYAKEDAMEHGRYLELKSYINRIGQLEDIDVESDTEQFYYVKDIAIFQGHEVEDFDIEKMQISKEELESIKGMRKNFAKYQDIDQYFKSESEKQHAMHIDFRNTLKYFLFQKNGIWENKDIALMQLDFVFEGLERTISTDNSFYEIDDDQDRNTQQTKDEGCQEASMPRILMDKQININQLPDGSDQQLYTTETSPDYEKLELEYDFSLNEKLVEYSSQLKRTLDSKMRSALIADSDIFAIKASTKVELLIEISEIIPDIGLIFKAVGLILQSYEEAKLKSELDKLANLYSSFEDLPKLISRKITILKRHFVMNLNEHFLKDYFDPKFISHVNKIKNKKKLTLPQVLALKDAKIIESCLLAMVIKQELIPTQEESSVSVANKVVNYYKGYQLLNNISTRLEPGEKPTKFERIIGFIIPEDIFENPIVPKFLKRGIKDLTPEDHKKRVKNYLMKLNQEQLFDLLGAIDPSNPKHQPLQDLIQDVNRGKEKKCTIF